MYYARETEGCYKGIIYIPIHQSFLDILIFSQPRRIYNQVSRRTQNRSSSQALEFHFPISQFIYQKEAKDHGKTL